jgi:hypothetical protein
MATLPLGSTDDREDRKGEREREKEEQMEREDMRRKDTRA